LWESLLGLSLKNGKLRFSPCLPASWEKLRFPTGYEETIYHIVIRQIAGETDRAFLTLDGLIMPDAEIPWLMTGWNMPLRLSYRKHSIKIN